MRRVLLAFAAAVVLSACGGTGVGRECTADSDCDNGQICYTTLPGGFCSKGCSASGDSSECPRDTVCSPHANTLLCAPTCETKADCRADYECNGVSGSDTKTCRPKA